MSIIVFLYILDSNSATKVTNVENIGIKQKISNLTVFPENHLTFKYLSSDHRHILPRAFGLDLSVLFISNKLCRNKLVSFFCIIIFKFIDENKLYF